MTTIYARERTLQEEIAPTVEERLPGVEVLAVELLSPSRFCVYVDHPDGVDHALCESVTEALGGYLGDFTVEVSSPGPERPLRPGVVGHPGAGRAGRGRLVPVAAGVLDPPQRRRDLPLHRGAVAAVARGRPRRLGSGAARHPVRLDRARESDRRGVET